MTEDDSGATYHCGLCSRVAATVRLVRQDPPAGARPAEGSHADLDPPRIEVAAGPLSITIGGSIVRDAADAVSSALLAPDARALFEVNLEFAPFWCPACARSYCGAHWRTWLVFDDEDPQFLDEQRGTCPLGHERMIQD